jgi:three-Cys-motif partner protein
MNSGTPIDEVAIHSRQKPALLEAYLRVWTQNVARNYGANSPSLDIYDMFAGTGRCVEHEYRRDEWAGTAIIAAEQLRLYPSRRPCHLILNSWASGESNRVDGLAALRRRVAETGLERPNRKVTFLSEEFRDALPKALDIHRIRAKYPSLWILDPYAAQTVPWTAVETIANHVGSYRDKFGADHRRRPELFMHFMTSSLQRNVHNPRVIGEALGCSETEWRAHLGKIEADNGTVLDALSSYYFTNLKHLYGRPPLSVRFSGKDGNPVSVAFLAVEHNAAWFMIMQESLPHFEEWRLTKYEPRKEWVRLHHRTDRDLPAGQRQSDLDEV